jgi:hypothetical protein
MTSWDSVRSLYHLSELEWVLVLIAAFFLVCGFALIFALLASRLYKSYLEIRTNSLSFQFRKILNTIVVNETFSQAETPNSAFEYRMAELRNIKHNSSLASQILIGELIKIKKNLSGRSAHALTATYYSLGLQRSSLSKLNRFEWKIKALGIRELAEMEHVESIPRILKFLASKNSVLREESFMAMVRIDRENPLSFLDHFHNDLTLWMRINIYHFLQKLDQKKLPQFNQWFDHGNVSIVLFSISMVRQFRQVQAIKDLIPLLSHENRKVRSLTVETLGELDAYEYSHELEKLATTSWEDAKLSHRIIQCLGKIGDASTSLIVYESFLTHPVYEVRFEAVKSLKKAGPMGEAILMKFNERHENALRGIERHLSEPLLQ